MQEFARCPISTTALPMEKQTEHPSTHVTWYTVRDPVHRRDLPLLIAVRGSNRPDYLVPTGSLGWVALPAPGRETLFAGTVRGRDEILVRLIQPLKRPVRFLTRLAGARPSYEEVRTEVDLRRHSVGFDAVFAKFALNPSDEYANLLGQVRTNRVQGRGCRG